MLLLEKYNIFCKVRAKGTNDAKDIIYEIDEITWCE